MNSSSAQIYTQFSADMSAHPDTWSHFRKRWQNSLQLSD